MAKQLANGENRDTSFAGEVAQAWAASSGQNEVLIKETFYGVKQILDRKGVTKPVVLIIKNIKSFNH